MAPVRKCYSNGKCYDEYTDAWHVWGKWLMLGLLVAFIIFLIPFSGYFMSLKRMQKGLQPVPGCGWMFGNPYKNSQSQKTEEPGTVKQRPFRYKPYNPYIQYQRGLMVENERLRMEQLHLHNGYSSIDLENRETEMPFDEKPSRR